MRVLILLLIVLLTPSARALDPAELTPTERLAVEYASEGRWVHVDPMLLLELLEVERLAGLPEEYRGLLLAHCRGESRCSPGHPGDGGLARGILQLHPWWERVYGVDRDNHVAAAWAWLGHMFRLARTKTAKCPEALRVAEAWMSRGGPWPGCEAMSGHTARLAHWRWRMGRALW